MANYKLTPLQTLALAFCQANPDKILAMPTGAGSTWLCDTQGITNCMSMHEAHQRKLASFFVFREKNGSIVIEEYESTNTKRVRPTTR
jgi:hypothetical protein